MTRVVSFRDPGGFLSLADDRVIRTVRPEGVDNVAVYLSSSAVRRHTQNRSVVTTRVVGGDPAARNGPILLEHERIPFPSFAHEWPAEMLLAAGDLTLSLCEDLLSEGLGLKDATPHNVLFEGPRAVFVDVLSFERRDARDPIWLPDAQFTRNFLIPLLLDRRLGVPLQRTFLSRRDGMTPSDALAAVPWPRRWLPPFLQWITLPARASRLERPALYRPRRMNDAEQASYVLRHRFRGLRKQLRRLACDAASSPWLDYESARPCYSAEQHAAKGRFVAEALGAMSPRRLLDVGANAGEYSLMAAQAGASVVAIDSDPAPVGALWHKAHGSGADILPLVVDFARPSPALGWRRIGSVGLGEGSCRVHLGAFNEDGGGGFGFFDLFRLWRDEVVVIADEHFKGVKPARLQVFDGLGEGVWSFLVTFHPEEAVPDVFGVGGAAESHVSAFDPAVSRKAFGGNGTVFSRMEGPTVGAVFEVGVLNVRQE